MPLPRRCPSSEAALHDGRSARWCGVSSSRDRAPAGRAASAVAASRRAARLGSGDGRQPVRRRGAYRAVGVRRLSQTFRGVRPCDSVRGRPTDRSELALRRAFDVDRQCLGGPRARRRRRVGWRCLDRAHDARAGRVGARRVTSRPRCVAQGRRARALGRRRSWRRSASLLRRSRRGSLRSGVLDHGRPVDVVRPQRSCYRRARTSSSTRSRSSASSVRRSPRLPALLRDSVRV